MATSQNPSSLFLNLVVCTSVTYDELTAVSRKLLVNNEYKVRKGGKAPIIERFSSERSRVDAMEREYGIVLDSEEIEAISGTKVAVENSTMEGNTVVLNILNI